MDMLEVESVDLSQVRLEGLGEKRPAENGEFGGMGAKKARSDGELVGDMKKVAEMVLVVAVMGKMRGGRSPTEAEKEMMAEARTKLAEVCEEFAPKDVFPRDAFGAVIEDLGLSKVREQRLGFRPPRMSIADKLLLTKQKMEKSEEFSLRSATYSSQRLQTNSGAAVESRGTSHTVRMFPSDKPNNAQSPSGGFQSASPLGHISAANSTSLPYQLPTSEVRPMLSSGLPSSNLGRDSSLLALPKVERPHFRLDGKSNGSSYTPKVQANSSGDHAMLKAPTWSVQPQSASSVKVGSDNKGPPDSSLKVKGAADVSTSGMGPQPTTSRPFITQTTSGNLPSIHQHLKGMNSVQAPVNNRHNDIGKTIQQLLQPKLPEHPMWIPPSRDYMNKALTCQMCMSTVNEVDSVLVCDACERGFHLMCLQFHNQKGIPKGEWHCQKCLTLSNGKPLPPKYGRVMRNMDAPKMSFDSPAVQASSEEKVGTSDEKAHQQKITANGNSGLPSVLTGTGNTHSHPASGLKIANTRETQGIDILSSRGKVDGNPPSGTCPNNVRKILGAALAGPPVEGSREETPVAESISEVPAKSATVKNSLDQLEAPGKPHGNDQTGLPNIGEIPSEQYADNDLTVKVSEKPCGGETLNHNPNDKVKQDQQGNPVEISGTSIGTTEQRRSSPEGLHAVDWIGDIFQVVDEKTYYQACCINGIVYKVQDYALFCFNNDILMPSKIQAMWEDGKTRSRWVIVNQCYLPGDLPEAVGCPCTPESSEVYESNHKSTLMAGLIRGPCEVLPPSKFIQESKRTHSRIGADDGLRPLFLCKWFYDEPKGLFREVST